MQLRKAQHQPQNTAQPCKCPLSIVSIAQLQYTLLVKVKAATSTDGRRDRRRRLPLPLRRTLQWRRPLLRKGLLPWPSWHLCVIVKQKEHSSNCGAKKEAFEKYFDGHFEETINTDVYFVNVNLLNVI